MSRMRWFALIFVALAAAGCNFGPQALGNPALGTYNVTPGTGYTGPVGSVTGTLTRATGGGIQTLTLNALDGRIVQVKLPNIQLFEKMRFNFAAPSSGGATATFSDLNTGKQWTANQGSVEVLATGTNTFAIILAGTNFTSVADGQVTVNGQVANYPGTVFASASFGQATFTNNTAFTLTGNLVNLTKVGTFVAPNGDTDNVWTFNGITPITELHFIVASGTTFYSPPSGTNKVQVIQGAKQWDATGGLVTLFANITFVNLNFTPTSGGATGTFTLSGVAIF